MITFEKAPPGILGKENLARILKKKAGTDGIFIFFPGHTAGGNYDYE